MAHADARRLFAGVPIVMRKVAEPRDDRIEHRDVDKLPFAGLFPLIERQQNTDRGIHAGSDIGDGDAGARRFVGIAGGGDNAALALNQEIVSLDVAIRTVLAVAGERAINQPRIQLAELFITEPKPAGDTRRIILEENIRALRQLLQNLPPLFFLDVDGQAALVAIEPNVTGRKPLHHRIPGANHVADAGPLDFDHFRAHVSEQAGRKRARQHLLESQDLDSIQRARGFRIACHTHLFPCLKRT